MEEATTTTNNTIMNEYIQLKSKEMYETLLKLSKIRDKSLDSTQIETVSGCLRWVLKYGNYVDVNNDDTNQSSLYLLANLISDGNQTVFVNACTNGHHQITNACIIICAHAYNNHDDKQKLLLNPNTKKCAILKCIIRYINGISSKNDKHCIGKYKKIILKLMQFGNLRMITPSSSVKPETINNHTKNSNNNISMVANYIGHCTPLDITVKNMKLIKWMCYKRKVDQVFLKKCFKLIEDNESLYKCMIDHTHKLANYCFSNQSSLPIYKLLCKYEKNTDGSNYDILGGKSKKEACHNLNSLITKTNLDMIQYLLCEFPINNFIENLDQYIGHWLDHAHEMFMNEKQNLTKTQFLITKMSQNTNKKTYLIRKKSCYTTLYRLGQIITLILGSVYFSYHSSTCKISHDDIDQVCVYITENEKKRSIVMGTHQKRHDRSKI